MAGVEVIDISSSSSESSEEPCERCVMEAELSMTIKGPKSGIEYSFDYFCVYPNRVALLPAQVLLLDNICAEKEPTRPLYVCTLKKAMIARENQGKMYFSKEFTKACLKGYVGKLGTHLMVGYSKNKKEKEVWMKMDKANKQAILTSYWMDIVKDEDYQEGEVVMFWFRRTGPKSLKMFVDRIEPGAFGLGTHKHLVLLEANGL